MANPSAEDFSAVQAKFDMLGVGYGDSDSESFSNNDERDALQKFSSTSNVCCEDVKTHKEKCLSDSQKNYIPDKAGKPIVLSDEESESEQSVEKVSSMIPTECHEKKDKKKKKKSPLEEGREQIQEGSSFHDIYLRAKANLAEKHHAEITEEMHRISLKSNATFEPELTAAAESDEEDVEEKEGKEKLASALGVQEGVSALKKAYKSKQSVHINVNLGRGKQLEIYATPSRKDPDTFLLGTIYNKNTDKPLNMIKINTKTGADEHFDTYVPTMKKLGGVNAETLTSIVKTTCLMGMEAAGRQINKE